MGWKRGIIGPRWKEKSGILQTDRSGGESNGLIPTCVKEASTLNLILGVVLIVGLTLSGCATLQKHEDRILTWGYRSLATAAHSYDAGMQAMADLYTDGRVTREQWRITLEIGHKVYLAFSVAQEALEGYAMVSSVENEQKFVKALEEVKRRLPEIINYINPILLEHGKSAVN